MFKWILRLLALAVLAGLGLFLWGRTLPERHVATVSATFARPAADLWNVLADPQRYPDWYPEVERVTLLPDRDGLPCWRETGRHGTFTVVRREADPPRRLVVELVHEPGERPDVTGSWIVELTPDGPGTRVTVIEDGRVHNPLFRALAAAWFGYQDTAAGWLVALGRRFGEDVTPRRGEVVFLDA